MVRSNFNKLIQVKIQGKNKGESRKSPSLPQGLQFFVLCKALVFDNLHEGDTTMDLVKRFDYKLGQQYVFQVVSKLEKLRVISTVKIGRTRTIHFTDKGREVKKNIRNILKQFERRSKK
jgi:hypothetical protein